MEHFTCLGTGAPIQYQCLVDGHDLFLRYRNNFLTLYFDEDIISNYETQFLDHEMIDYCCQLLWDTYLREKSLNKNSYPQE